VEDIWLISIAALLVGAAIGFLMGRSGNASNKQAELAEELENTKAELDSYKVNVNKHFEKTATLVNELTTSYKDVHEHLANGAQDLCDADSINLALEPTMQNQLEKQEESTDESNISDETDSSTDKPEAENSEAPRDYAPKSPEDEGTLSETYGLKEEQTNEEAATAENPAEPAAPKSEEKK
jgi:uncharacterized membrane-anchored protein YhcB (DUF1043 family)